MKFTKMQGIGNDYIYMDCTETDLNNPAEVAVKVSDRHFGIGADGLILIKKSDKADFYMEMYNADGSQGKMCGNGIRCVGKYVYDNGLTDKTTVTIDTLSGVKILKLNVGKAGKVVSAVVDMGEPILEPEKVPVTMFAFGHSDPSKPIISEALYVNGKKYDVTCVSMGNPHAVVYLDNDIDIWKVKLEKIGPYFEKHEAFPERINTEFIQILGKNEINMRVWERGSGETLACGTGACASVVSSILNGYCDETVTVHLIGGDLKITWDRESNHVIMEGPAETVCTGDVQIF